MNELLLWPPLLWTARIALLILIVLAVSATGWLVWRLVRMDRKRFRSLSGTIKLFGQEIAVNAGLDSERDEQLDALDTRLGELEESVDRMGGAVTSVVADVRTLQGEPDGGEKQESGRLSSGSAGAPEQGEGTA